MYVARLACICLLLVQTDSELFPRRDFLAMLTILKKRAWFPHFGWPHYLLNWSNYYCYRTPHPKSICRALYLDVWKLRICSFDSSMVEW